MDYQKTFSFGFKNTHGYRIVTVDPNDEQPHDDSAPSGYVDESGNVTSIYGLTVTESAMPKSAKFLR